MALFGNAGEWSETYAVLRILEQGGINQSYSHEFIENNVLPVISMYRTDSLGIVEFFRELQSVRVESSAGTQRVSYEDVAETARLIFASIKSAKSKASISIPAVETTLSKLGISSLAARSTQKADVLIQFQDLRTGTLPIFGFSIKSTIASAPTLLNASGSTNFIYRIMGYADPPGDEILQVNGINSKSKLRDRIREILGRGYRFEYSHMQSDVFKCNLQTIESNLPELISEILLTSAIRKVYSLDELVKIVSEQNPLGYNRVDAHPYYEYKIRKLLSETALGLMPGKPWRGIHSAGGGFLVVQSNGDVSGYNFFDQNAFETHLLESTKLETASMSKHGFGEVYKERDDYFIKLNLQIRYK